tara:strand:+ start:317 stop:433 length:117 start_codon:yes stop_codon:yes gene_type:complete
MIKEKLKIIKTAAILDFMERELFRKKNTFISINSIRRY